VTHRARPAQFRIAVALTLIVAISLALPIRGNAWNAIGHEAIARIAWDRMTPQVRAKAAELLRAAPPLAGIDELDGRPDLPQADRDRELFVHVSVWADAVRDRDHPERRDRFHKGTWHYRDLFWEQRDSSSKPIDRPDITPDDTNAVERLGVLSRTVADKSRPDSLRAIDLAWLIHHVCDINEPLHNSVRVTSLEPKGDQCGNLFKLDPEGRTNLHAYWDDAFSRAHERNTGESEEAYIARLAKLVTDANPFAGMSKNLKPDQFDAWAREGFEITKRDLYPPSLIRGQPPAPAYEQRTREIAEPAIAKAGYRLADLLNRALK
jgi:hypothetical protein